MPLALALVLEVGAAGAVEKEGTVLVERTVVVPLAVDESGALVDAAVPDAAERRRSDG